MKRIKQNVWIRIAGNASNIRAGKTHGWRCFFRESFEDPPSKEIPLRHWYLEGEASESNLIATTAHNGNMTGGVVAWIDLYGNAKIENDVLKITLRPI